MGARWARRRVKATKNKSLRVTGGNLLFLLTSAHLDLHTFTPADLDLHNLKFADLDLHTFTPADIDRTSRLTPLKSADLHLQTLTPADHIFTFVCKTACV